MKSLLCICLILTYISLQYHTSAAADFVNITLFNTSTIPYDDPYDQTPEIEYFCRNSFQVDLLNNSRFLVGLCRPGSNTSSAIGTLPREMINSQNNYNQSVNVLYGNPSVPAPNAATAPDSWDGINMAAKISFPEQFIQAAGGSILYFIDIRSCLRKVDRTTGEVSTVIGICQNGTLGIPGTGNMQSYGMAYFEEDRIFVFTVTNHGLYVCYEQTVGMEDYECRRAMEYKYISERIAINARMLLRGINSDGEPNEFVWQKVRHGLNRYNFTTIFNNLYNTSVEILPDNDTFVHYASIHTRETLEPNAWHKDTTQDLGLSDATISFSPDGTIMLDIDSTDDGLYFIDTDPSDGIDNMTKLCDLNQFGVRIESSDPTNCTFTDVTGGVWLECEGIIVVTEKDPVAIRVVRINKICPTTTTTTTSTTVPTTTTTAATNTSTSTNSTANTTATTTNNTSSTTDDASVPPVGYSTTKPPKSLKNLGIALGVTFAVLVVVGAVVVIICVLKHKNCQHCVAICSTSDDNRDDNSTEVENNMELGRTIPPKDQEQTTPPKSQGHTVKQTAKSPSSNNTLTNKSKKASKTTKLKSRDSITELPDVKHPRHFHRRNSIGAEPLHNPSHDQKTSTNHGRSKHP